MTTFVGVDVASKKFDVAVLDKENKIKFSLIHFRDLTISLTGSIHMERFMFVWKLQGLIVPH